MIHDGNAFVTNRKLKTHHQIANWFSNIIERQNNNYSSMSTSKNKSVFLKNSLNLIFKFLFTKQSFYYFLFYFILFYFLNILFFSSNCNNYCNNYCNTNNLNNNLNNQLTLQEESLQEMFDLNILLGPNFTKENINLQKTIKNLKTIVIFIGTRPEMIKLSNLILKLKNKFNVIVISTGQHQEMLQQTSKAFKNIKIDIDLKLMQKNQNLPSLYLSTLISSYRVLKSLQQQNSLIDLVITQGDTTTALATTMASYFLKLPIAHVEAGLRTFDFENPFPEEFNRKIIDVISSLHFTPTEFSKRILLKENLCEETIHVTGNTGIDALRERLIELKEDNYLIQHLTDDDNEENRNALKLLMNNNQNNRINILVTSHRRENLGEPLENICKALQQINLKFKDKLNILFPVHLNPNVQQVVKKYLQNEKNINLLKPLSYEIFPEFLQRVDFIVTDSGGLTEESIALGKPCILLRKVTERPEGIYEGNNNVQLVGTDIEKIINQMSINIKRILNKKSKKEENNYYKIIKNTYGDGTASEQITNILTNLLIDSKDGKNIGIKFPYGCARNRQFEIANQLYSQQS
ncbi:hypothetical protein ABK040_001116 [Willaertia magna]